MKAHELARSLLIGPNNEIILDSIQEHSPDHWSWIVKDESIHDT